LFPIEFNGIRRQDDRILSLNLPSMTTSLIPSALRCNRSPAATSRCA